MNQYIKRCGSTGFFVTYTVIEWCWWMFFTREQVDCSILLFASCSTKYIGDLSFAVNWYVPTCMYFQMYIILTSFCSQPLSGSIQTLSRWMFMDGSFNGCPLWSFKRNQTWPRSPAIIYGPPGNKGSSFPPFQPWFFTDCTRTLIVTNLEFSVSGGRVSRSCNFAFDFNLYM